MTKYKANAEKTKSSSLTFKLGDLLFADIIWRTALRNKSEIAISTGFAVRQQNWVNNYIIPRQQITTGFNQVSTVCYLD